jgi:hypothetical protein
MHNDIGFAQRRLEAGCLACGENNTVVLVAQLLRLLHNLFGLTTVAGTRNKGARQWGIG